MICRWINRKNNNISNNTKIYTIKFRNLINFLYGFIYIKNDVWVFFNDLNFCKFFFYINLVYLFEIIFLNKYNDKDKKTITVFDSKCFNGIMLFNWKKKKTIS